MQFHEEFLDTYENNYITNNRKGESLPAAQPFGLRYSEMPAVLSFLTRKVGERFPLGRTALRPTPSSGLKRRPQRLLLVVLFLSVLPLFAETYVLGGKKGWADVNVRNGITTGKGRYGYESLELDSKHKENDPDTDLLLDFENSEIIDKAGKYKIVKNSVIPSKKSACGKGSGLSRNLGGGIVLFGDETSFFGNENHAGSFMIDFWICPSTVENGEVLMNWRSSRNVMGDIFYQLINISFYQNKVIAVFQNIFDGYTKNSGELVLQTTKSIIPNKWSHHTIAFIEDSGIIEYRIDEKLEAIEYVTDTGHENGTVYPPVMGVAANFELCPNYTGLIDDFYILRSYEEITTDKTEYSPKILNNLLQSNIMKDESSDKNMRKWLFDIDTKDYNVVNIIKKLCGKYFDHILETKNGYHIVAEREFDAHTSLLCLKTHEMARTFDRDKFTEEEFKIMEQNADKVELKTNALALIAMEY